MIQYLKAIVFVAALIAIGVSVSTCQKEKADKELLKDSYDKQYNIVKFYQDKNGKLQQQIKTHELTVKQLKDYGNELGFENKELKKQVGSLKNLVAHWQGKAEEKDTIYSHATDTLIIYRGQNINVKRFKWNNSYLFLDQSYNPVSDSLKTIYDYKIDFGITAYRQSKGFLKPKQLVTDFNFSDPNLKIKEIKGFVITEPKKKWYETNLFKYATGFAIGYGITRK